MADPTTDDVTALAEHVIDRNGLIWRVVRDGGMATRGDYDGIVSIGIAALARDSGPLVSMDTYVARIRAGALREVADVIERMSCGRGGTCHRADVIVLREWARGEDQ